MLIPARAEMHQKALRMMHRVVDQSAEPHPERDLVFPVTQSFARVETVGEIDAIPM